MLIFSLTIKENDSFIEINIDASRDTSNTEIPEHRFNQDHTIEYDIVSDDYHGLVLDVAVEGDYAYLAGHLGLEILDISDVDNPIFSNKLYQGERVEAVCTNGSYLYAGVGGNLKIIDITDPTNPFEIGSCFCDYPWKITHAGGYLFLSSFYSSDKDLIIVDANDPSNPFILGRFNEPNLCDFAIEGNYAYLTTYLEGLKVINITTLSTPQLISTYFVGEGIVSVSINDSLAYISDTYGFEIIDFSDLFNPFVIGNYSTHLIFGEIVLSGDFAFCTYYYGSLEIFDVSDLNNPLPASSFAIEDRYSHNAIFLDGDYAYLASYYGGVYLIDITDPYNPQEESRYDRFMHCQDIYAKDDILYIAGSYEGLHQINKSNPYELIKLDTFLLGNDIDGRTMEIFVEGDYIYIAEGYNDMQILNISDPSNPIKAGNYSIYSGEIISIFVENNYAYLLDWFSTGLTVVDVTNPSNPIKIGNYSDLTYCFDIYVTETVPFHRYAYIASTTGVYIIDITSPGNPTLMSRFNNDTRTLNIQVIDDFAFLACDEGLKIYNIADVNNPFLVSSFQDSYCTNLNDVKIRGDFAYVVHSQGLDVLNITDISNPVRINSISQTMSLVNDIYIEDLYAYIGGQFGFQILYLNLTSIILQNINHNPLNPKESETIEISVEIYSIVDVENVSLTYRIDGGAWNTQLMGEDLYNIYKTTIGSYSEGTDVEYYITVMLDTTNYDKYVDNNYGSYYSLTIAPLVNELPKLQLTIITSLLVVTSYLLVSKYKKSKIHQLSNQRN